MTMSEATKWTPGPWIVEDQGELAAHSHAILTAVGWERECPWIATVNGYHVGPKELEEIVANAHLIAAAPALFAALETIAEELDNRYDGAPDSRVLWMGSLLTQARAALDLAQQSNTAETRDGR
jgi:hypothetical protein